LEADANTGPSGRPAGIYPRPSSLVGYEGRLCGGGGGTGTGLGAPGLP
jgi:hypothetical protein